MLKKELRWYHQEPISDFKAKRLPDKALVEEFEVRLWVSFLTFTFNDRSYKRF